MISKGSVVGIRFKSWGSRIATPKTPIPEYERKPCPVECPLLNAPNHVPSTLLNDTFLRALQRQPTDYTPIWLMRQAGRYLPEYNATRSRAGSFMGLATNPDYATEVTLQPLERFPLDAAILFSDILTIPDAMGLGLNFVRAKARDSSARSARKRTSPSCTCRISTPRCAT